ncbi:MAG: hypothetical protein M1133_06680, partial [Armatimonadetes bacterium]|nr:hypothetical protein [Armatimonadota bacterium]
SLGETYNFSNMIKSIDTVDGVKVATINQEITRAPKNGETKPTLRATVESAFALDTGKLMKSHVDCGVAFGPQQIAAPDAKNREPSKQDQSKASANIKMDIVLAK